MVYVVLTYAERRSLRSRHSDKVHLCRDPEHHPSATVARYHYSTYVSIHDMSLQAHDDDK